jgi:membrane associated rhomboid family serine protease
MGRSSPIVTQALIAVNVVVFIVGLTHTSSNVPNAPTGFSLDGGLFSFAVAQGEWWRIVTAGFLHANLIHLGFNMFALWMLGSQLEAAVGRLNFAVVYATSLFAGSLGVLIVSPNQLTVGASGAIFGLLGLALAGQRAQGINIWQSGLGGILLINLALTFTIANISIGGHLGGLAGGYACGVFLYEVGPRLRNAVAPVVLSGALGALCFALALAAAHAQV